MARKAIPESVQSEILLKSRRRCCLCFWLDGEDEVQKGQIAHLDRDATNNSIDNLVFLCLNHHDEYDSKPRQTKGLREEEVRRWRNELHLEMEYRFRTVTPGPLLVQHDSVRHKFLEENNQCGVFRVSVKNAGTTTIRNVGLKISEIQMISELAPKNLSYFCGLRLCVSESLCVPYSHPDSEPTSLTILHPTDEIAFDVVRLCLAPGNSLICHSGYYRNPQTKRLNHRPDGNVEPGFYRITLRAQGDDVSSVSTQFEFESNKEELVFREIRSCE